MRSRQFARQRPFINLEQHISIHEHLIYRLARLKKEKRTEVFKRPSWNREEYKLDQGFCNVSSAFLAAFLVESKVMFLASGNINKPFLPKFNIIHSL